MNRSIIMCQKDQNAAHEMCYFRRFKLFEQRCDNCNANTAHSMAFTMSAFTDAFPSLSNADTKIYGIWGQPLPLPPGPLDCWDLRPKERVRGTGKHGAIGPPRVRKDDSYATSANVSEDSGNGQVDAYELKDSDIGLCWGSLSFSSTRSFSFLGSLPDHGLRHLSGEHHETASRGDRDLIVDSPWDSHWQ